jgi:hypothetical protein
MALIRQNAQPAQTQPAGPVVEQAVQDNPLTQDIPTQAEVVQQQPEPPVVYHETASVPAISAGASVALSQDDADLTFDFTTFPAIALKTEGIFEDGDKQGYGKEFFCRILGWKKQFVFRGAPVLDNKKDVCYSSDQVYSSNGILIADKVAEWKAQGKQIEMKEYLSVIVEMIAPDSPYDGEFRVLNVSPSSRGRFSGHATKAKMLGGGDAGGVVTKVTVGTKVTNAVQPFYPWNFAVVK